MKLWKGIINGLLIETFVLLIILIFCNRTWANWENWHNWSCSLGPTYTQLEVYLAKYTLWIDPSGNYWIDPSGNYWRQ